jgi:cytochrome oxidase Cu insertion factor (SCO1/SenC/PrrC family)
VGNRVPTIPSNAADGRPLDLAALRGKFVLLHFWATRNQVTPADVADLKRTFNTFGRDPRFVMIGLNQDESADRMRLYAAHRRMAWEQRHIGSTSEPNPIAAAFGVRFPPAVFLIGPDGRIVAKDLQGEAIKQAVAKALQ